MPRGRPRKWQEEEQLAQQKTLEAAQNSNSHSTENISMAVEVDPQETRPTKTKYKNELPVNSTQARENKRLPTITISYLNSSNGLVIETYICSRVDINKETTTALEGEPTSRKDFMNLNLSATVVKVNN